MQPESRKVQIYYKTKHYASMFPTTYEVSDIENWMRTNSDFIHQLQQNDQNRILSNWDLTFKYNNLEADPTKKDLKLNEFHPKKRLTFYVQAKQSKQPPNINNLDRCIPPSPEQLVPGGSVPVPKTADVEPDKKLKGKLQKTSILITSDNNSYTHEVDPTTTTIQDLLKLCSLDKSKGYKIILPGIPAQDYSKVKSKTISQIYKDNNAPKTIKVQFSTNFVGGNK